MGLTPHIKALRTSLAEEGSPNSAAALHPRSASQQPGLFSVAHDPELRSASQLASQQRGDRRASLAEAPRANLLFESGGEAEVTDSDTWVSLCDAAMGECIDGGMPCAKLLFKAGE